jgi:phosphatidylserine decarboxylase
MIHTGIARRAATRLLFASLVFTLGACCIAAAAGRLAHESRFLSLVCLGVAAALGAVWMLFAVFTIYFFRDPEPNPPSGPGLVVSPGHGKVDAIEQITESQFMGGPCHRISTFLSVIDVHVQNAPVAGKIAFFKYTAGQFLSALKAESGLRNENVLLGFASAETPGEKIGVRLIAGVLARRIVPFVRLGDDLQRGDRISLIQFGSRCDLYVPLHYKIRVKPGDKVVGSRTVMASKC